MNEEYQDFLNSNNWKQKKSELISERGLECERCHKQCPRRELHLHHLSYDHEFGTERDEDLMLVCKDCHNEFHQDINLFKPLPKEICPECQKKMLKTKNKFTCIKCGLTIEIK